MAYNNGFFKKIPPRKVQGGIRAQNKWGSFATRWWGMRWLQTLESFNIGERLKRGMTYARKGQVISLDIQPGKVTARVQGTRRQPYRLYINLKPYSDKEWNKISAAMLEKPEFVAKLMNNEMPDEIESVFRDLHLPLFPQRSGDLHTECSCPDWSNPCKHIAAVYYLMAEAFDNDPFLLFTLRGKSQADFIRMLTAGGAAPQSRQSRPEPEPEPLPEEPSLFWGDCSDFDIQFSETSPVQFHAALPKRLGALPFWRSSHSFVETMEACYKNASVYAADQLDLMSGD
ncbi:MAG TPA: hypothetical protein ENN84_01420 [Candidatus Marinimicrobia bacterium]|nr:hypothetical protein [Candidatus Neomarinimicrobiota bacterium]